MEQSDKNNVVKRPIPVALLCIWCFFTVIWGSYSLYLGLTDPNIRYEYTKLYGNITAMALITSLILLLYLLGGIGLWRMKRWGANVFVAKIILSVIRTFLLKNFDISLDWPIILEFFIIAFYFRRTT